jgi:hypothetical protein
MAHFPITQELVGSMDIPVPELLCLPGKYGNISIEAAVIYGRLVKELQSNARRGTLFFDAESVRFFVVLPDEYLQLLVRCQKSKLYKIFNELKDAGLIEIDRVTGTGVRAIFPALIDARDITEEAAKVFLDMRNRKQELENHLRRCHHEGRVKGVDNNGMDGYRG